MKTKKKSTCRIIFADPVHAHAKKEGKTKIQR